MVAHLTLSTHWSASASTEVASCASWAASGVLGAGLSSAQYLASAIR